MNFISTLAIAMGASWVSGINLYASVATLGLLSRFASLKLPGELEVLTNWWVIGIALFLFVVEFFADKIQVVDSVWDVIHTFIRIPAGAVLAATAFGDFDKSIQMIAFLLGGGLALSSHGTKAAARLAINASPEPVSNVVVSLFEDVLAIASILLSVFLPVAVFFVIAAGLLVSFWLLPKVVRFFRKVVRKVSGFFRPSPAYES
jgi:flagellar biosynthesis protein FliQ